MLLSRTAHLPRQGLDHTELSHGRLAGPDLSRIHNGSAPSRRTESRTVMHFRVRRRLATVSYLLRRTTARLALARLAAGGLALSSACAAAMGASGAAPVPERAIPEVTIEAPEPRYVAPTRRDRIGRIWAPVLINGLGPFRLVLDTGASRSAVVPRVALALGAPLIAASAMLHGVTGSAKVATVRAERLEVGELHMEGALLPVIEDAFGGAEGVLGNEGLREMRIHIEFNADRITIARSRNQRVDRDFTAIPFRFVHGRVPVVAGRVGRVRVKAIIDTGAQATTGNLALLAALKRRSRLEVEPQQIIGVTLDVQSGDSLIVPKIALGDLELRGTRVTFLDLNILSYWELLEEPTLVVGMDVLGLLDTLIIDYRRRELQIRLNG